MHGICSQSWQHTDDGLSIDCMLNTTNRLSACRVLFTLFTSVNAPSLDSCQIVTFIRSRSLTASLCETANSEKFSKYSLQSMLPSFPSIVRSLVKRSRQPCILAVKPIYIARCRPIDFCQRCRGRAVIDILCVARRASTMDGCRRRRIARES